MRSSLERRTGSFVLDTMSTPLTLPLLGGSLLAAAAVGLHLGESAVGLINPIHFQGPAIHPRARGAAIEEPLLTQRPQTAYAELYGWDEGETARAEDCGDCEALQARFHRAVEEPQVYSALVPYFGPASRPASLLEPQPEAEPEAEPAKTDADKGSTRDETVERYAYYRVEAEPSPAEPAAESPEESELVW
jgi:hypothetical protein